MKLSNDILIGVAIGVGVAILLTPKSVAPQGPVITQGGNYVPPMYPSPKQQKTGGAQVGRRYSRVNYPVYIGI